MGSHQLLFALSVICSCCGSSASAPLAESVLPLSQIFWRPERSRVFVGSPSICKLANGTYLASHDDFGPGGVSEDVLVGT